MADENPLSCPRCRKNLDYVGTKRFHEGTRWGVLGELGELFVNKFSVDLLVTTAMAITLCLVVFHTTSWGFTNGDRPPWSAPYEALAQEYIAPGLNLPDNAKAIEAAKLTSVRQIDNSLPDTPFEKWLRDHVGVRTRIVWEVNDCGEQSGNPQVDKERDFPMCVSALVDLAANKKLDIQLVAGTSKSGVNAGPATYHHAAIIGAGGQTEFLKSLSRLPEALKAFR